MRITAALRDAIMTDVTRLTGGLDAAEVFVGVAQSIANKGVQTTMADVVPAQGAVATRTAVGTWSAPYTLQDGRRVIDAPAKSFRPASEAESQQVLNWFIADAATGGNLLGWGDFPGPVLLPDADSSVTVIVRVTVDPEGRWGAEETYNG